ncbi:MAG: AtpZ/AtpI family protein [Candidatus Pacebacteria bacterium]|nr:AtpZ/AtpI family protein [Candidatus Paceibacterota bacterium]
MSTEIGFLIAIPLIVCILSGIYIDNTFKTTPYVTIVSVIAGIWLIYIDMKYLIMPILEGKNNG